LHAELAVLGQLPFDGDFRSQARAVEERLDIAADMVAQGVLAVDILLELN